MDGTQPHHTFGRRSRSRRHRNLLGWSRGDLLGAAETGPSAVVTRASHVVSSSAHRTAYVESLPSAPEPASFPSKLKTKDQRILVFVCVVITLFLERVLLLNALRHPPLTYATFMEARRRLSSYSPTHASVEDCPQVGYAPISDVYSSQGRAPDGDWTAGGAKVLPSLFSQLPQTAIS